MKLAKNKKGFFSRIGKPKLFAGCVALVLLVYAIVTIASQNAEISVKRAQLEEIDNQRIIEEVKVEEINNVLNSNADENNAYIEKSAREDLDYAYKDERIFINISGE